MAIIVYHSLQTSTPGRRVNEYSNLVKPCPLSPAREKIEVNAQRSAPRWSNCTDNVWYLVVSGNPSPIHIMNATDGLASKLAKRTRSEIQVRSLAARASVGDRDGHALPIVWSTNRNVSEKWGRMGINSLHSAWILRPQMGLVLGFTPL